MNQEQKINELERRVNELENPQKLSDQFIEAIRTAGFLQFVKELVIYAGPSARAFPSIFVNIQSKIYSLLAENPAKYSEWYKKASATLLYSQNNLANGQQVYLHSTGTLPAPLSDVAPYWVTGVTGNSFSVESPAGGGAITMTNSGIGTHYWSDF